MKIKNIYLSLISISGILLFISLIGSMKQSEETFSKNHADNFERIELMPLVKDEFYANLVKGKIPYENRSEEVRKWLSAGLKIEVRGGSGSGTIVYYDHKDGTAYVQSCGHLWDGNMSADAGLKKNLKCTVVTWYHNNKKLDSPKKYQADVIYYSNKRGEDCSLVKFKPDWVPNYFPIAPDDYKFDIGMKLHSVGSDGGTETAHYDVEVVSTHTEDIITKNNSPRPGRSGGGLMDENYYVGICWGTSEIIGTGIGYFTPLKTLRKLNELNGYGWLNDIGISYARLIPIKDRNNPQGEYPNDYIPLPER